MDLDADAELDLDPRRVFTALEDLGSYPNWLTIVGRAEPTPPHPQDQGPAWGVDLVGRVGPLRRSKRVRMVRTEHLVEQGRVRFERIEHDGRSHNAWILTGSATPSAGGGTRVRVHLHYGGGRTLPGADLLLRQEARRAGDRLAAYLRAPG